MDRGFSRLDLDLRAMEDLIVDARRQAGTDIDALCGKVGGLKMYVPKFQRLASHPVTVIEQTPAASRYRVAGIGRVTFLRDAETQHPLIALASIVGKALREFWMEKIVDFYAEHVPDLPRASGYNDPVTNRFVLATEPWRREHRIDEECFRRRSVSRGSRSRG
jgi:ribonuclease HII